MSRSQESENQLQVRSGEVRGSSLSVEVANPTGQSKYVWVSRRAFEYDPDTHELTLYFTEQTPPPPPGIELISKHPRIPEQVEVPAGSNATVDLEIPAVARRRVPGEGLGMSFVEEPIDQIDQVHLHLQVTDERVTSLPGESPAEHSERLRSLGNVINVTITPTSQRES